MSGKRMGTPSNLDPGTCTISRQWKDVAVGDFGNASEFVALQAARLPHVVQRDLPDDSQGTTGCFVPLRQKTRQSKTPGTLGIVDEEKG
jgi:hypothetical protein